MTLLVVSSIASGVSRCQWNCLPESICKAITISITPPAILIAGMVRWNIQSIAVPPMANRHKTVAATRQAFSAADRRLAGGREFVVAMKIGTLPSGSMIARIITKDRKAKLNNSPSILASSLVYTTH